jgi:hypothetical protein
MWLVAISDARIQYPVRDRPRATGSTARLPIENYPECAEKLPWTWELATVRLLLEMGLGDRGDGGVDLCIPVTDTGRTRRVMRVHRHGHSTTTPAINPPLAA